MYRELWKKIFGSVGSIRHRKNGEEFAVGSGFIVDGYLVTNNHVFLCDESDEVEIRFVEEDGHTISFSHIFSKADFTALIQDGSDESNWDFAILEVEALKTRPSLSLLRPASNISIGTPVAFFGYQFGAGHLSMHSGIISARFTKDLVKYIQIDGSVNQGNSGGPLINVETGEVIGIVTRSAKGLTKMFNELMESFDGNIRALEGVQGMIGLGTVDPIRALMVSQEQMKRISKEIKRSANVGIGYAFDLLEVRRFFERSE